MEYRKFYRQLFAPLESQIGSIDVNTIFSIIGFDCGGLIAESVSFEVAHSRFESRIRDRVDFEENKVFTTEGTEGTEKIKRGAGVSET